MECKIKKRRNTFNKKYKRVGYVFRDRYKAEGIYTENHLYSCIKYIHNNPVKANLCMLMKEYKYSSYNEYLKEKRIINDESIELLFGKIRDYKKDFNFIHDIEYGDEYTFAAQQ